MSRFRTRLIPRVAMTAMLLAGGAVVASGSFPSQAADHPVLTAVGDVNTCRKPEASNATAALAAAVPGPIAVLGDWVEGRQANEIRDCVNPGGWGALKGRIQPTPGDNGEYGRNPAKQPPDLDLLTPYYQYFFGLASPPEQRWYSYDVGTWHVVVLDTNCSDEEAGCPAHSPQVQWLKADLAAANARCLVVTTHHNIIEQPGRKTFAKLRPLLQPLYDAGADLWVSGHRHTYRRYAKINLDGQADPDGIRHFVVGTGGHPRTAGNVVEGGILEKSNGDSWGVLRLTLKPGGYDWAFAPVEGVAGSTPFTDSGTATCHGPGVDMVPSTSPTSPTPTTTRTTAPPTTATTTPGPQPTTPTTTPSQHGGVARSGYWMLGRDGAVFAFGDARHHGERRSGEAVDLEPTPSGLGYWVVDAAGVVSTHGDASHFGNVAQAGLAAGEAVTSLSASPSGRGYWVFTSRGRVIAFGDAGHFGDMAAVALNGPVLDSIPTPSGRGYYMVASDGGIFAFGDAGFYGSMGDRPLNAPVRSLVPDGDGAGYWLVASDGGIFAFDAPFRGSMGDVRLNRPVTGMVRFGNGYLMVGEDGGIFNFSDRPFAGSLGDQPPAHPIIAVAPLED